MLYEKRKVEGGGHVAVMYAMQFKRKWRAEGRSEEEAQLVRRASDLYAAVRMAAFLAAGYKAPLSAVVFSPKPLTDIPASFRA
jgi:H+/Cl- antiporter ClcA